MTLRGGYELGFALACTSALLIVLLGGELPILAWGAIAAVWFAGRAHMMGRTAPAWVGTAIGLLSLVSGFAIVLSRGTETLVLGATIGIVGLLVGRVMTRTELSHDLQALLLTLLLVFAGAGLNSALSYGLAFVVYAIAAVWALVTRQLVEGAHREAARRGGAAVATTLARTDVVTVTFFAVSGLLSLVILSGTLILFIAFPRVGIGGFGVALQGRRLPDRVSLSSPPRAAMSSQTVARVQGLEYYEYTRGLYLRAATYDRLTRDGFDRNTVSTYQGPREMQGPAELGPVRTYEIFLHPVAGSRLLTLGASDRIAIRSGGKANPSIRTRIRQRASNGDVILDAPLTGAIRYWVEGRVTPASPPGPTDSALTVPEKTLAAWLELPEDIDGRLVSLAKEITSGQASAYDKAVALRRFFLGQFQYTLDQPTAGSDDPLTEFVLDHRAGHCEHFATAFATMLRAVGVPSRVVGGFQGGVWDESSDTVVFGLNNAHAWVEWYQPGRGWVLDDATPPFQGDRLSLFAIVIEQAQRAWDDYVLDYGLVEQFQLARQVSRRFTDFNVGAGSGSKKIQRIVGLVVASIFVGLGFWLWRRRRIAPSQDALAIAIERALSHVRGEPVTPAETFTEVLNLIESVPEWQSHLLHQAVDHYEHRRFGGRRYDVNREIELIRSLESVHKHNAARAA